jgi:alcohol dehydrogenase class IV
MYTCCRYYGLEGLTGHEGDASFTVEVNHFTFGPGCLREAGSHARALGMRRVALYTDKQVNALPYVATVKRSLEAAGCEVAIYWDARSSRRIARSVRRQSSLRRATSTASSRWAAAR